MHREFIALALAYPCAGSTLHANYASAAAGCFTRIMHLLLLLLVASRELCICAINLIPSPILRAPHPPHIYYKKVSHRRTAAAAASVAAGDAAPVAASAAAAAAAAAGAAGAAPAAFVAAAAAFATAVTAPAAAAAAETHYASKQY